MEGIDNRVVNSYRTRSDPFELVVVVYVATSSSSAN